MKLKDVVKKAQAFSEPFRVSNGKGFRLKDVDPGDTLDFTDDDKPRRRKRWRPASRRWASCRPASTPRTGGACC